MSVSSAANVRLGGRPFFAAFVQRDANELESAALELAESEERYCPVVDNVSDLVLLHDSDGKLVYVSPSINALDRAVRRRGVVLAAERFVAVHAVGSR